MSKESFYVKLEAEQIDQALQLIDQVPGRSRVAVNRALRETVNWGRTQMRREMARAAGIPQKFLRERVRASTDRKRMTATLWAGTYPVLAEDVGLMKLVTPMMASDEWLSRPFEATMPTGHTGVYVRAPGDPNRPAQNRWTAGRKRTPGTENLPISRPTIDVEPPPDALERIRGQMMGQFQTRATRLLRWELEKAAQRQGQSA